LEGGSRSRSPSREDRRSSIQNQRIKKEKRSKSRSGSPVKRSALKFEPNQWSREDLMEKLKKIGKFTINKVTGVGEMKCLGQRFLSDDIIVLLETLRRYSEIQHIRLQYCLVTDELFKTLLEDLCKLRHLKTLDLSNNLLTSVSVDLIIEHFPHLPRKLEILDLRSNSLSQDDGIKLFNAFPFIAVLNGIDLNFDTKEYLRLKILDVSSRHLKLCELGIIFEMLKSMIHIEEINLSHNDISPKGLVYISKIMGQMVKIHSIDLSYNPVVFPSDDLSGLNALKDMLKTRKHCLNCKFDGIDIPEDIRVELNISLMVNRSISTSFKTLNPNRFYDFITTKLNEKAPPVRQNIFKNWQPVLAIDKEFSTVNRIPGASIEIRGNDIILFRKPFVDERKERHEKFIENLASTTYL
jgi:hypothetical protein